MQNQGRSLKHIEIVYVFTSSWINNYWNAVVSWIYTINYKIEWGPIFTYSILLDDIMIIIWLSPDSSDRTWHLLIGNSNESLPGVEF